MTASQSPWRIVCTRSLPDPVMNILRDADSKLDIYMWHSDSPMPRDELLKQLSNGADGLLCVLTDKIDKEVLDTAGDRLKIVSTISVGFNHIDSEECHKRNILIGFTPDVLTDTTADTTVGLVLAACRRFKEATASVTDGTWGTWTLFSMCGVDVHSSTVGIIGLGRIGAAVGRRLRAFDCNILYTSRSPKPEEAEPIDGTYVSMDELLSRSDIVIPLCPLNSHTKGMFNKEAFNKMKKTAVFINAARGELVNQEDLLAALKNGDIYAAGLDVTTPEPIAPDHPLTKCPNCYILPHIGSSSMATRTAMASLAVRNMLAAYKGEDLPSQVKPS